MPQRSTCSGLWDCGTQQKMLSNDCTVLHGTKIKFHFLRGLNRQFRLSVVLKKLLSAPLKGAGLSGEHTFDHSAKKTSQVFNPLLTNNDTVDTSMILHNTSFGSILRNTTNTIQYFHYNTILRIASDRPACTCGCQGVPLPGCISKFSIAKWTEFLHNENWCSLLILAVIPLESGTGGTEWLATDNSQLFLHLSLILISEPTRPY